MEERLNWRHWGLVGILTLLWHLAVFFVPWDRIFPAHPFAPPAKIDINPVSPQQLEKIREQWRKQRSLLLQKDNTPAEKNPPPDARYLSEKNRRVEKETRATQTRVLPRQARSKPRSEKFSSVSPLSKFGVPLRLGQNIPEAPTQPNVDPEAGGDQALLERELPPGSENMLNTQESIYYSFYSRLYQAIGPVWESRIREVPSSRRVSPGDYLTQVEVLLDRSGNLAGIRYHRASGIAEFDAAVESAWKRIGKFPNPPLALIEKDGYVHTAWTFSVTVGENFNWEYRPPQRNY